MDDYCDRCKRKFSIGYLVKLTRFWGGPRTGETVCLGCKKPHECYDSACD